MFNRHLEMRVVRNRRHESDSNEETRTRMTPEELNALVLENAKYVALFAGAGYAVKKIIDTASEIALIAARSNFK